MAKKDKLRTNEDAFSESLELPDWDFDLKPPKDDRKPVTKVLDGIKEGVKNSLTGPGKIENALKKILPEGYGEVIDLKNQSEDTIRKLYDNTAREIKPSIKDMTRAVDKLLPESAKKTKSVLNKIDKWATENGYTTDNSNTKKSSEDYEVASQIGNIFKFQMEQEAKKDEELGNREIIKEGLSVDRHKDQMGLLNTINIGINTLAQYQNRITSGYQKKTLELSYRKYFLMGDMLEEMKASNEQKRLALKDIVKNTALPEIVKTRMSEQFHEISRNKFISGSMDALFSPNSKLMEKFKAGLLKTVGEYAQDASFAMGMAAMPIDMLGQQKENGEDLHKTAGSTIGGIAGDWIQNNVFNRAKKLADKHEGIRHFGKKLLHTTLNLPQHIIEKGRKWSREDGIKGVVGQVMTDASRNLGPETRVHVDNLNNLHGPSIFTNLASKSITEIIPGYLALIFKELQVTRTGNENIELTHYDLTKNAFSKASVVAKNLMNKILSPEDKKKANDHVNTIIDQVDPNKTLDPKARAAFAAQILRDKHNGTVVGDAERYAQINNLNHPDIKEHAEAISKAVKSHLESGTAEQRTDKNLEFNKQFRWLDSSIKDPRATIQNILNAGQHGLIKDSGFITKDANCVDRINFDELIKNTVSNESEQTNESQQPDSHVVKHGVNKTRVKANRRAVPKTTATKTRRVFKSNVVKDTPIEPITESIDTETPKLTPNQERLARLQKYARMKGGKQSGFLDIDSLTKWITPERKATAKSIKEDTAKKLDSAVDSLKTIAQTVKENVTKHAKHASDKISKSIYAFNETHSNKKEKIEPTFHEQHQTKTDEEHYRRGRKSRLKKEGQHETSSFIEKIYNKTDFIGGFTELIWRELLNITKTLKSGIGHGKAKAQEGDASLSGDSDTPTNSWFKLTGRKIKPLLKTGLKTAKSITDFGFSTVSSTFGAAKTVGTKVVESISEVMKKVGDVHYKKEKIPRMTAVRMKAGQYMDESTKKIIKKINDIRGNVIDIATGLVVLRHDEIPDIVVRTSIFEKGYEVGKRLAGSLFRIASDISGFGFSATTAALDFGKGALKVARNLIDGPGDVYVKSDLKNPRLTKIAMKAGLYFSRKTGKRIDKMSDIDGVVESRKDGQSEVVLSEEDLKEGICDSKGEPIRGLWEKLGHKAAVYTGKALGMAFKGIKSTFDGIKKAFGLAGTGALNIMQAFADATGFGIGTWGKKNTETLEKIYALLDERIPKPKKILGDAGDGLREGSWQEDQKEEQKGESPDKLSRIKNKAKGVGGAIKGAIADKVLGKKEKKEEGEKEGGLLDTAEGTVAGEMAAKGLDKFGKPLVKGAWNTAKGLGKAGAGKLLKYGALGAEALAGTAAGSAVLGGLGTAGTALAGTAATAGTAIASGAAAAGTAAAGMAGTALAATGTALAGAASAIGAVLSAPVVLGVLAAAAVGVGGYLLYKHFKKGATDDPLTQYRLAQYGFTSADEDIAQKVLQFEDKLIPSVKYEKGQATLDIKAVNPDDIFSIFGFNANDPEMPKRWMEWFKERFKPVFLTDLTALNTKLDDDPKAQAPSKERTFADIKDLTPKEKLKYLSLTVCSGSVYNSMTSPFLDIDSLKVDAGMVGRAYKMAQDSLLKESKETKPSVKNDALDKSKVGTVAAGAIAASEAKDKAGETKKDNSLGGIVKDVLGKAGTVIGYTPGGMLLKAVGSAISFVGKKIDKFAGGQVDALQAIRFRAYGLKEMDRQKVNNLRYLETIVAKGFSGDPQQGTPKWKGSPEDVMKEASMAFGVIQTDDKGVKAWLKWFTDRFLPVYTLYRGLLLSIVGKPDQDAAEMALKPETTLAVAEKLAATDVWGKSTSPWDSYELNTNSDGVKENLEDLRSKSKKETTLPEAKANPTTVATTDKPPVKTPVDNALKNVAPEVAPKAVEGPQFNSDGTSTANKDPNLINASYNPNGSSDKSTNTPAYNGRAGGVDPSTLGSRNTNSPARSNTSESHGVDPATLGSKGKFTGSSQDFWNKMHEALLGEAKKAGVASPEAVAALGATQSSLETGYGKHTAGGNNYFGIKAKPGDPGAGSVATQEFIGGKMVTINDKFRKYNNMEESAADYIKFLQENKRYRAILSAKSPEEAIMLQAKSGYATDPGYFNKLQGIYSKFSGTTGAASHGVDPTTLSKKPDDTIAPRTNTAASHGVDPATLGKKTVPGGVVSSDGTPVTSGDGSPVSSGSSDDAAIKPAVKPSLTPAPSSIGSNDTTIPIKQAPTFSSAIRNNNVPNNVFAQTNTAPPVSQKQPLDIGPDIKSIDSTLKDTLSVDKDNNSILKSLLKEVIAIANKLAADDKEASTDTTTTSSSTPRQSAPAPTLPVFVGRMA